METRITGKMSIFGGPGDSASGPNRDLAFVTSSEIPDLDPRLTIYFLSSQPDGTSGTLRRLNPSSFYICCRWNYAEHSADELRNMLVSVRDPRSGRSAMAKPIDWGPEISSGKVAKISPGLAEYLDLSDDDVIEVTIPTGTVDRESGAIAIIKAIDYTYIQARNYLAGRTRPVQNIILHGSGGQERDDVHLLTRGVNSVHWYITRDGRYYQFVNNADTALHVGKAVSTLFSNAATIGIEHEHIDLNSGNLDDEAWPEEQIRASANLAAYLCHRYGLGPSNILTHAYVADPRGRVSDPLGFPIRRYEELLKEAMTYTWVAQSVREFAMAE